jgi:hypothetical protein
MELVILTGREPKMRCRRMLDLCFLSALFKS